MKSCQSLKEKQIDTNLETSINNKQPIIYGASVCIGQKSPCHKNVSLLPNHEDMFTLQAKKTKQEDDDSKATLP